MVAGRDPAGVRVNPTPSTGCWISRLVVAGPVARRKQGVTMRTLLVGMALLVVLAACQPAPSRQPVRPLAQEASAVETPFLCLFPNGTWRTWDECINVPFTPTPHATHTPSRTPTPEMGTPLPTLPPPSKQCKLRSAHPNPDIGSVFLRDAPTTSGTAIGRVYRGTEQTITRFVSGGQYLWAYTGAGWFAVRERTVWWAYGTLSSDACPDVDGWPPGLEPPPILAWAPPEEDRGLHLNIGANAGVVFNMLDQIGVLKGIDTTESIVIQAANLDPDLVIVWRNWCRALFGCRDGPGSWGHGDPVEAAETWFAAEYATWNQRGLLALSEWAVVFFEYRNELAYVGAWEHQFDIRMIELANEHGLCLALFSDGYGTPRLNDWVERLPVVEAVMARECQPGRYHAISYHVYEGVGGGLWKIGRPLLVREQLPDIAPLLWIMSEYGYDLGRGPVNCQAFWTDDQAVQGYYASLDWVVGYAHFALGPSVVWTDITPCLD